VHWPSSKMTLGTATLVAICVTSLASRKYGAAATAIGLVSVLIWFQSAKMY
jgi:hypothetical protein